MARASRPWVGVAVAGALAAVTAPAGCAASSRSTGASCAGAWCADAGEQLDAPGNDGPTTCGDGRCAGGETCLSCSLDCGQCPACALAPSCSNALGAPSNPTPRPDLDQGVALPDAGTDAGVPSALPGADGCQNPQLRMRIVDITTYSGSGTTFCIVDANDGATSEVAITPQSKALSDGETFYFDPATSMFWGQTGLHTTTNNLTITYNCFLVVDNSAWSSALQALGQASQQAGGIAGPYGWAFGVASAGAQAAAAAINATNGAKLKLNAQQTIDKSELLDLTNGRVWSIRKSGGGWLDGWNWQIDVESWGCALGAPTSSM
jgi:hypothetical protein